MTLLPMASSSPWEGVIVLFDWNGTLVLDSSRALEAVNVVLGRRWLPPLDGASFGERFKLPLSTFFAELGVQGLELSEVEVEWGKELVKRPASQRPHVVELLEELRTRGALTGVVSALSCEALDADVAAQKFDQFDFVVGSAADKPSALRALRGQRHVAVYLGDTEYDMKSAVSAGWAPVGVSGGYQSSQRLLEAGAQAVLSDIRSLVGIITRLHENC